MSSAFSSLRGRLHAQKQQADCAVQAKQNAEGAAKISAEQLDHLDADKEAQRDDGTPRLAAPWACRDFQLQQRPADGGVLNRPYSCQHSAAPTTLAPKTLSGDAKSRLANAAKQNASHAMNGTSRKNFNAPSVVAEQVMRMSDETSSTAKWLTEPCPVHATSATLSAVTT